MNDQLSLFDTANNNLVNSLFRITRVSRESEGRIEKAHLSPREIEALVMIAEDMTVPDVAKVMRVSVGYINNLTYSARRKMGTHSTMAAYSKAVQLGIIKIEILIQKEQFISA